MAGKHPIDIQVLQPGKRLERPLAVEGERSGLRRFDTGEHVTCGEGVADKQCFHTWDVDGDAPGAMPWYVDDLGKSWKLKRSVP
jgi:hypothetical protein